MLKAFSSVAVFLLTTCAVLFLVGAVLKFYWQVFMFGWGLL